MARQIAALAALTAPAARRAGRAAARWWRRRTIFAGFGGAARRRCCPPPPSRGSVRRPDPARARPAACLAFGGALRFRRFGRRRGGRSSGSRVLLIDLLHAGDPCTIPGARPVRAPARRPGKPACSSPGNFFLVSRKSRRSLGSKLLIPVEQPASAPDSEIRTAAAIKRLRAHGRFLAQLVFPPVSFLRPAAAMLAALRRANAGWAVSRRHLQSDRATCAPPSHR